MSKQSKTRNLFTTSYLQADVQLFPGKPTHLTVTWEEACQYFKCSPYLHLNHRFPFVEFNVIWCVLSLWVNCFSCVPSQPRVQPQCGGDRVRNDEELDTVHALLSGRQNVSTLSMLLQPQIQEITPKEVSMKKINPVPAQTSTHGLCFYLFLKTCASSFQITW